MIEQNEIDEKLLAYLLDELDDVEREEVKVWLEECECNKEYFREFQRVHLEFQWGVYAREVKSDFNVLRKKLRKHSSLQVWYGVAAAVVILLCGWNAIMEFGRDRGKTGTGGKKGNHSTGKITGHISVVFGRGSGDG